jgi:hypothetical protein
LLGRGCHEEVPELGRAASFAITCSSLTCAPCRLQLDRGDDDVVIGAYTGLALDLLRMTAGTCRLRLPERLPEPPPVATPADMRRFAIALPFPLRPTYPHHVQREASASNYMEKVLLAHYSRCRFYICTGAIHTAWGACPCVIRDRLRSS